MAQQLEEQAVAREVAHDVRAQLHDAAVARRVVVRQVLSLLRRLRAALLRRPRLRALHLVRQLWHRAALVVQALRPLRKVRRVAHEVRHRVVKAARGHQLNLHAWAAPAGTSSAPARA